MRFAAASKFTGFPYVLYVHRTTQHLGRHLLVVILAINLHRVSDVNLRDKGKIELPGPGLHAMFKRMVTSTQPVDAHVGIVDVIVEVVSLNVDVAAHVAGRRNELAASDGGAGLCPYVMFGWVAR